MQVSVRNVGKEPVKISFSSAGLLHARPEIEDATGKRITGVGDDRLVMPPAVRYVIPVVERVLKPGEEMTFAPVQLRLAPATAEGLVQPPELRVLQRLYRPAAVEITEGASDLCTLFAQQSFHALAHLRNLIHSPTIHLVERKVSHETVKGIGEAQLRCANCSRKNHFTYPAHSHAPSSGSDWASGFIPFLRQHCMDNTMLILITRPDAFIAC